MLGIFVICLFGWRRIRGHPPEGRIFWLYLTLYGAARFGSSFLRLDPVVAAGLQEGQLLGLVYVLAGLPALIWLGRRAHATRSGQAPPLSTTIQ